MFLQVILSYSSVCSNLVGSNWEKLSVDARTLEKLVTSCTDSVLRSGFQTSECVRRDLQAILRKVYFLGFVSCVRQTDSAEFLLLEFVSPRPYILTLVTNSRASQSCCLVIQCLWRLIATAMLKKNVATAIFQKIKMVYLIMFFELLFSHEIINRVRLVSCNVGNTQDIECLCRDYNFWVGDALIESAFLFLFFKCGRKRGVKLDKNVRSFLWFSQFGVL